MLGSSGSRAGRGRVPQSGVYLIEKKVFTGVENTLEFKDIPQYYTDIELEIFGRGTATGGTVCNVTFNNDTGANYDFQRMYALSTAHNSEGNLAKNNYGQTVNIMWLPDNSFPAGQASGFVVRIAGYSQANFHKSINTYTMKQHSSTSTFDQYFMITAGGWRSTAPITSLQCTTLSSGNYAPGSYAVLRGYA